MKTDLKECPRCGATVLYKGQGSTLVGYYSPPGHDHNDNCKIDVWTCAAGHQITERKQNVCSVDGCDWKGKTDCFCSKLGVTVS